MALSSVRGAPLCMCRRALCGVRCCWHGALACRWRRRARRLALMTAAPVTSTSARRVSRLRALVDCRSGHSAAPRPPYVAGIARAAVTADVGGAVAIASARAHTTTSARGANSPRNSPQRPHPRQRARTRCAAPRHRRRHRGTVPATLGAFGPIHSDCKDAKTATDVLRVPRKLRVLCDFARATDQPVETKPVKPENYTTCTTLHAWYIAAGRRRTFLYARFGRPGRACFPPAHHVRRSRATSQAQRRGVGYVNCMQGSMPASAFSCSYNVQGCSRTDTM